MTKNNSKNQKSGLGLNQKIAIGVGAVVLVAGLAAGGIYLAIHQDESENSTVVVSDAVSANGSTALVDGKNKIESGGTYTFTGSTSNGKIVVDTTEAVTIILDNVSITNTEGAAIKCKEGSNVTIQLVGENKLASTDKGTATDSPANAVSSDGDLTFTGDGSVTVTSNDKGLHADGKIVIESGTFDITGTEAIEATYVVINGGTINISASDDGINAAQKSDAYDVAVEINGGDITIVMGQGDTDAIDSNGDLYINGGTLNITAQSPFDYDGKAEYNGGTMIVNGEVTTEITNQFAGGMGGGMMMPGGQQNAQNPQNAPQGNAQQGARQMPGRR